MKKIQKLYRQLFKIRINKNFYMNNLKFQKSSIRISNLHKNNKFKQQMNMIQKFRRRNNRFKKKKFNKSSYYYNNNNNSSSSSKY